MLVLLSLSSYAEGCQWALPRMPSILGWHKWVSYRTIRAFLLFVYLFIFKNRFLHPVMDGDEAGSYSDRGLGPFGKGFSMGMLLEPCWESPVVQETPPRLLNACGGSSQPPPQWEHPLRSVLLSVSAHACRVCDLVLGIPTLSHIYGCHLQVASQFNEYPEIPHIKRIFLPMRVGISASFLDRKTYHQWWDKG